MDYIKINGRVYDHITVEAEENFNILYSENTGRTLGTGAPLTIDPYGTFYGHKVTFYRKMGYEAEYDELFMFISKPTTEGFTVELPHNQSTITYKAYASSGSRAIKRIDKKTGKVFWDKFQVNFIPMKAQVTP